MGHEKPLATALQTAKSTVNIALTPKPAKVIRPTEKAVILIVADAHIYLVDGSEVGYKAFVSAIANESRNIVIDLGDLMDEYSAHYYPTLARATWDDIALGKELTLGNHDHLTRDGEDYLSSYENLITDLGYSARVAIAGSKFNRSFAIDSKTIPVRIIMLDTNMDASNVHQVVWAGTCQPDALTWIENELATCTEDTVVICSHHSPHNYAEGSNFESAHALALKGIIDAAVAARPALRVVHWAGHKHEMLEFNAWPNYPGYIAPSMRFQKQYVVFEITDDDMSYKLKTVTY